LGATDTDVYIIVKDSGIGIPEEEMNKIYDPFSELPIPKL
jgi:signal transduction histidine kinase